MNDITRALELAHAIQRIASQPADSIREVRRRNGSIREKAAALVALLEKCK